MLGRRPIPEVLSQALAVVAALGDVLDAPATEFADPGPAVRPAARPVAGSVAASVAGPATAAPPSAGMRASATSAGSVPNPIRLVVPADGSMRDDPACAAGGHAAGALDAQARDVQASAGEPGVGPSVRAVDDPTTELPGASPRHVPGPSDRQVGGQAGPRMRGPVAGRSTVCSPIPGADASTVPSMAGEAVDRSSLGGPIVDLGSGGGTPGLVVAWHRPDDEVVLVERRATRADHLRRLVQRLELTNVRVLARDARGLRSELTTDAAAVTARGFGPPRELLRLAAPLLGPGGVVVVTEPPPAGGAVPTTEPGVDGWRELTREELAAAGFRRLRSPDGRVAVLQRTP